MTFLHMPRRTSLIIFVTCLVVFNTVLNSFVSCCETGEDLFLNNDEKACCTCCNNRVDRTFPANHSLGKTQATVDDCDSCVCLPYATTSDNYFVFIKRTSLPFHFAHSVLATASVQNNETTKHHVFSPTIVNQKTDCLSTVVLLM